MLWMLKYRMNPGRYIRYDEYWFSPHRWRSKRMIEVNIFNFDRLIYGKQLKVFVKKFLRGEEKFSSLEPENATRRRQKKRKYGSMKVNTGCNKNVHFRQDTLH